MTLKIVSKGEPLYCGDPGNCCAGTGGGSGGGLGMVALKSGNKGGTMGELQPILAHGRRREQR